MGRVMGLDVGRRRVGVSVSDPMKLLARGIGVVDRKKENLFSALERLVKKYEVERIVVGIPMDTRGGLSRFGEEVKAFAKELERRLSVSVVLWNEVYTTQEAKRIVGGRDKEKLDMVAAEIILQSYLDHENS